MMNGIWGLSDWQWWGQGFYFLFLTIVLFCLPGWQLVKRMTRLPWWARVTLSPVVGMVVVTVVAYLLGTLGGYSLVPWVLTIIAVVGVASSDSELRCVEQKLRQKTWWQRKGQWLQSHWQVVVLVLLGLMLQMPAIFGSGWRDEQGVRFFFTNNSDGLMHVGFINSMAQEFPPLRPEVDAPLTDYHYFSDLLEAQLVRLGLPSVNLFFQFFPVWLSIVTTLLIYASVLMVTKSRTAAGWTTLVFLLAGDGGCLLMPLMRESRGWEMTTFDNGADQFLNMPYATAKAIFFAWWLVINHYWQKKQNKSLWLAVLLGTVLVLFKVYWWLLVVSGWAMAMVGQCLQEKKLKFQWLECLAWGATAGVGGMMLRSILSAGDQLLLTPLAWVKTAVGADNLNWQAWLVREPVVTAAPWASSNWLWWLAIVMVAVIFIFGARILGLAIDKKMRETLGARNTWFLGVTAIVWPLVGLNTMQAKGGLNTFNFLVIAGIAMLVLLGVKLAGWWQENKVKQVLAIAVLLRLAPRTIRNSSFYWQATWQPTDKVAREYSNERLQLLAKLQELTDWQEVILVHPDNQDLRAAAVVPALAGRKTFLSNEVILATHNWDYSEREQQVKSVFEAEEWGDFVGRADNLGTKYWYVEKNDEHYLRWEVEAEKVIFENEAGKIVQLF